MRDQAEMLNQDQRLEKAHRPMFKQVSKIILLLVLDVFNP